MMEVTDHGVIEIIPVKVMLFDALPRGALRCNQPDQEKCRLTPT